MIRRPCRSLTPLLALLLFASLAVAQAPQAYPLPMGSAPWDIAVDDAGAVWFAARASEHVGRLDPSASTTLRIPLGEGSHPYGVVIGPDGAPYALDSTRDRIVRVDPHDYRLRSFPLPGGLTGAELVAATLGPDGALWWTARAGYVGYLDPVAGTSMAFAAPGGYGPYGIVTTPSGAVWFTSLEGDYLGRIDRESGDVQVVHTPESGVGPRRIAADAQGRLWVTEWHGGHLARFDPAADAWRRWPLPGERPRPYAVTVDGTGAVWVSDYSGNALLRFDPESETFARMPHDLEDAQVRRLQYRDGAVWAAEAGADRLLRLPSDLDVWNQDP